MKRARFPDPYEGMSEAELDRHFSELINDNRERQRSISIRFPEALLEEVRRLADELGIPYQTFIKRLLEQDVARLRKHSGAASASRPRRGAQGSGAAKKRTTRHPRIPV